MNGDINEDQDKDKGNIYYDDHLHHHGRGRVFAGLFLLIVGGLLLLKTANILFFPGWFFSWPVFLIAIGFFSALKHRFRGGGWLIFIIIGSVFLINDQYPDMHLRAYTAPIIIISLGLIFLLRPRRYDRMRWSRYERRRWERKVAVVNPADQAFQPDQQDFIDITSVFSSIKKNILSKSFRGGDITCLMGGAEIDLTQADFTGKIKIDATNIFGGTKLLIPPNWDVQSNIVSIFGGVDDKRQIGGISMDNSKVIILDGTCVFGGIEIKSF